MELSGHMSKYSNSNNNNNTTTASTNTCSSSSCMMSFGDNNTASGAAMAMIMPFMSIHHHHHQHHPNNHSPLFLPLPLPHPNNSPGSGSGSGSSSMIIQDAAARNNNCFFMDVVGNNNFNDNGSTSSTAVRAKIMAHPLYHRLLAAYVSCQKVGAPAEVVGRLEEACAAAAATMGPLGTGIGGCIGEDPALDQFMEAYCEMLTKYEQELSKPFKEAMLFLHRVESQFKAISLSSPTSACGGDGVDWNALSDEEGDMNANPIDPLAEDRELKCQLLRKYSGYLGSLKQEFLKKRKKGKLPKEARQQLLDWWTRHYKWPYPSESQKIALAEATGLDQKQINNWFINQRKRHWKPSEDMQFVVMDATHPHYYMNNVLGNPYPMDLSPTML